MYQRDARAGAFLGGDRVSGQDIRDQNGMSLAVISLARVPPIELLCPQLLLRNRSQIL